MYYTPPYTTVSHLLPVPSPLFCSCCSPHVILLPRHLRYAARVVSDGAEGRHRQHVHGGAEHPHGGCSSPEQSRHQVALRQQVGSQA